MLKKVNFSGVLPNKYMKGQKSKSKIQRQKIFSGNTLRKVNFSEILPNKYMKGHERKNKEVSICLIFLNLRVTWLIVS